MTKIQEFLNGLDEKTKSAISKDFISTELLYETTYLIVKNGHALQESKPSQWEEKLKTVQHYQSMVEKRLDEAGLEGKEVVADIASDYFEDYVHYREAELKISDSDFFKILNDINR